MPAGGVRVPLTEAQKREIYSHKGTGSSRNVGKKLGCSKTVVLSVWNTYKPGETANGETQAPVKLEEQHEQSGDNWAVSLPKTRICTLDQLIEHCKIDLEVWEVDKFVCNKWEVGAADKRSGELRGIVVEPLFQVKAFLRKRKNVVAIKNEIAELKQLAKRFARKPIRIDRSLELSGNMLEMNMPDIHFGKQAWSVETGWPDYDIKIAETVYWKAFNTLLSRAPACEFDEVVLVVGNDLLQSDNTENQTTKGTPVSCDSRYHKVYKLVRNLMIDSIQKLRTVGKRVKVIIVRGNHDSMTAWHLGDSLECFFHEYKDVEIDNEPRARKYHQFGKCMLMLTHGHESKLGNYPMHMAVEQPEMWAATKYRECHTGHKHTKVDSRVPQVGEHQGVRVRILSALCPPDDWHADNGYIGNLQAAEAFVWNKDEGMIGTAVYSILGA